MGSEWVRKITDASIGESRKAFEYTMDAARKMNDILWDENFDEVDSELIFEYLYQQIRLVSFGDYLKRYIYEKAELREDFESVDPKLYQDILLSEFAENHVPFSLQPTTAKPRSIVKGWLTHDTIRRETVFLLGFGLRMTVEDVTTFLEKGIREQDFNFNNPEEVIYWFCLKNGYSYRRAEGFLEEYESMPADEEVRDFDEQTVSIRSRVFRLPEQELLSFLRKLKSIHRAYPFSNTARNTFLRLLEAAKQEALKIYQKYEEMPESATADQITNGDLERILYNGIPLDQRGNLMKASASRLKKQFAQKRLSRQRIASICDGKAPVDRTDLITLAFFVLAQQTEDVSPNERFHRFVEEINQTLTQCYMGEINISNSYEAFVLMCLLTDWPMATFSEVWEMSYEEE